MNKGKILTYKILNYALPTAIFAMVLASIIIMFSIGANAFNLFSYFTIQSNILIALFALFLIVANILKDTGKADITNKIPFLIVLIMILNIVLTGVVYLTMLLPEDIKNGAFIMGASQVSNIMLHGAVPLLSLIYFLVFTEKKKVKLVNTYVFILYPIVYWGFTLLRSLSGIKFMGDSLFPYFFLDPEFNNQGFGKVLMYVSFLLILFYAVGLLLTLLSNHICKKKTLNKEQ